MNCDRVTPELPTSYGNGLSYYEEMRTLTEKTNEIIENVNDHENRIEALEDGGGGSNVTMVDNTSGGVDLTVDDTTRTLARQEALATFDVRINTNSSAISQLETNYIQLDGEVTTLESEVDTLSGNLGDKLNKVNTNGEELQFVDSNNNRNSTFNSYNVMYSETDEDNVFMTMINSNEVSVVTAKIATGNEQHIEIKSNALVVADFNDWTDTNISISDLKNIKDIAEIKEELLGVSSILGSGVFE